MSCAASECRTNLFERKQYTCPESRLTESDVSAVITRAGPGTSAAHAGGTFELLH